MSGIGESRTELLNWLNQLLNLNYRKVEECGTGAAYCQIMDSIYQDIPMHRVKFHATAEYEMQTNYKVLQGCFTRHNIEKTVLVEKLIRCRFQDNLEFLQWLKKYWVQNRDDSIPYEPDVRRKFRPLPNSGYNSIGSGGSGTTSSKPSLNVTKRRSIATSTTGGGTNFNTTTSRPSSIGYRKISSDQLSTLQSEVSQAQGQITNLHNELDTYKDAITIMERERDFYFGKLRDIEILVQSSQDLIQEGVYPTDESGALEKFLNKVQQILYATEEGFENGQSIDDIDSSEQMQKHQHQLQQEQEQEQERQKQEQKRQQQSQQLYGVIQDIPTHNLITDEETF